MSGLATMAKCESGEVVESVELDWNFTLWSAFSVASFRRKIINAIRCSGRIMQKPTNKPEKKRQPGSNKLSELLKQLDCSVNDEEVRKKEEALEVIKRVAKKLKKLQQKSNSEEELKINLLEGAREVRRLTKEHSEARTTLALLGVIPPLVG